jgi:hypothetical protein
MDWYVLLTPLLLLPIVSLLVFVGCGLEKTGTLAGPGEVTGLVATFIYDPDQFNGKVDHLTFWCELQDDPSHRSDSVPAFNFVGPEQSVSVMLDDDTFMDVWVIATGWVHFTGETNPWTLGRSEAHQAPTKDTPITFKLTVTDWVDAGPDAGRPIQFKWSTWS